MTFDVCFYTTQISKNGTFYQMCFFKGYKSMGLGQLFLKCSVDFRCKKTPKHYGGPRCGCLWSNRHAIPKRPSVPC